MGGNDISENISKKKRGRPRLYDESMDESIKFVGGRCDTLRGQQNYYYLLLSISVLRHETSTTWLLDFEKAKKGDKKAWKVTILQELGRIADDADLLACAQRICELKPTAREAVAIEAGTPGRTGAYDG